MRQFNVTGSCNSQEHYMVNLDTRLAQIKEMIDNGKYFVINRGRQYGKTTMLSALEEYLCEDYIVISMDFQTQMSHTKFKDEETFSAAFAKAFMFSMKSFSVFDELQSALQELKNGAINRFDLVDMFMCLSEVCAAANKPIVLIIDEVDSASNNQVFLDFLAQLRGYYLQRNKRPTFQSVILAGVHDIRNLRQKIRSDTDHKHNSPWNIASSFDVDMSFSSADISGMLQDYENDHHTGMNINEISQMIYDYTSGYPVLVSSICKLLDEKNQCWTRNAVIASAKVLMTEKIPLIESLINKLEDNENLRNMLRSMLFYGKKYLYNVYDSVIGDAVMYGFVKNQEGSTVIANRIFETVIYDWFISLETTDSQIFSIGVNDKNQFIRNRHLDMERILEKFVLHFNDIYGSQSDKFREDDGRKLFLLYLRPIINGIGNYYIEAQTRDQKRTDVIVDYLGEQFIIEMKIWHGEEYNNRGEQQLSEYLDYYHIDKGYLLSFNFNKNKQIGMQKIQFGNKEIVEAVV